MPGARSPGHVPAPAEIRRRPAGTRTNGTGPHLTPEVGVLAASVAP